MFRSVLSAFGATEIETVVSAPGLPYQKRYQTAWRVPSVPLNWPELTRVIALDAFAATGPGVGVLCGVNVNVAFWGVAVGVAMVDVGVMAPTKLTVRSE